MSHTFEIGQVVRHKAKPELRMVIKDFSVTWPNNLAKRANREKNPLFPICSFWDEDKRQFVSQIFDVVELEPFPEDDGKLPEQPDN